MTYPIYLDQCNFYGKEKENYFIQPMDLKVSGLLNTFEKLHELGIFEASDTHNSEIDLNALGWPNFLPGSVDMTSPHLIFWLLEKSYFKLNDIKSSITVYTDGDGDLLEDNFDIDNFDYYKIGAVEKHLSALERLSVRFNKSCDESFILFKHYFLIYKKAQFETHLNQLVMQYDFEQAYKLCLLRIDDEDSSPEIKDFAHLQIAELIYNEYVTLKDLGYDLEILRGKVEVDDEQVKRVWRYLHTYQHVLDNSHPSARILQSGIQSDLSGKTYGDQCEGKDVCVLQKLFLTILDKYCDSLENIPQKLFKLYKHEFTRMGQQPIAMVDPHENKKDLKRAHEMAFAFNADQFESSKQPPSPAPK